MASQALKKIKRNVTRLRRACDADHRALWKYRELWKEAPLDERAIVIESQQGRTANGNMFYVAKELLNNPLYADFKVYFVAQNGKREAVKRLLHAHDLDDLSIVIIRSPEYVKLLATAKYLVTDTSFPPFYIKKPGQIIWNTWHGTPLKTMGRRDEQEPHSLGNVQKNLALADFLSFPNEYTAQHMVEDYMLENLSNGTILFSGYPRNTIFFDKDEAARIKNELDLNEKTVYAYMPTWRPLKNGVPARFKSIGLMHNLLMIDDLLSENELLLVSIHPLDRKFVSFDCLKHIEEFPTQYETYEVLNACDALVTDYSSVLFDYAITGKKIVLFDYDRATYLKSRGTYFPLDDLPFPRVQSTESLMTELRSPKSYADEEFLSEFCPFESAVATADQCKAVFLNDCSRLEHRKIKGNGKPNVLIYAGNLAQNGITKSLSSILSCVDLSKANFFLTFTSRSAKGNIGQLKDVPNAVSYIPTMGKMNMNLIEKIVQYLYEKRLAPFSVFANRTAEAYKTDLRRLYGKVDFRSVIQFNGYDYKKIFLFSKANCTRAIYAHSDMQQEAAIRRNSRLDMLGYAYSEYDKVAVVSEDNVDSTKQIANGDANVLVVPNIFDHERVLALSEEPIAFDEKTVSNMDLRQLKDLLNRGKNLISIGRFSPEKQHRLLIEAFNEVWQEKEDLNLIIIGGVSRGSMYEETCDLAESLPCGKHVALIKQMKNPYSILKQCDGFILSSMYEGFGLVIIEADVLGVPVVSTAVQGPSGFIKKHGGTLVDNSLEGIKHGLELLAAGNAPCMNVDYEDYNKKAIEAFESLALSSKRKQDSQERMSETPRSLLDLSNEDPSILTS